MILEIDKANDTQTSIGSENKPAVCKDCVEAKKKVCSLYHKHLQQSKVYLCHLL